MVLPPWDLGAFLEHTYLIIQRLPLRAAAAAKSLQSCPTLVWPHRRQLTRLSRPWDSLGKNTGVSCHSLLQRMKVKSESEAAQSCWHLVTPWTAAYQAPPSMRFSRQEDWNGLPLPSPLLIAVRPFCEIRSHQLNVNGKSYFACGEHSAKIKLN